FLFSAVILKSKDGYWMATKRRSWILIPTLLAGCAIAGGIFGPRVQIASAATTDDDVRNSMKEFTRVYDTVEQNFADPVNSEKAPISPLLSISSVMKLTARVYRFPSC